MSDILTDYREWRASLEDRIGTHSAGCHMWPRHERCMIHRLAAALAAEQAKRTDACELHARESQRLQPDRTPEAASTPDEGTSQRECAEPVAWLAHSDEFQMVSLFREHAEAGATENEAAVVPLYRSPTLTDAEREAIAYYIGTGGPDTVDDTLRGLLER